METVFQDMKFALRVFRKSSLFTAVVVLTLALGIGANTAIFSIVNAVLLRSLPFRDAHQLQKIAFNNPGVGLRDVPFSVPEFEDLKSRAGVFEDISVVWPVSANLTGAKEPQRLELLVVSPNYFSMLGATPQIGRLFGAEDFARGSPLPQSSATASGAVLTAGTRIFSAAISGSTTISTPSLAFFHPHFATREKPFRRTSRSGPLPDTVRIHFPHRLATSGSYQERSRVSSPVSVSAKPRRAWILWLASCGTNFPWIILPWQNGRSPSSPCSSRSWAMSVP